MLIGPKGRPDNPTLWHYTTADGFLGILEQKELWCTNLLCMNDSSELKYSRELFLELILSRTRSRSSGAHLFELIHQEIEFSLKFMSEVYSASFCGEGDRLAQWRGYSSGGGFSIGFSANDLVELAGRQGFELVKVIYDEEVQVKLVNDFLDSIADNPEIRDISPAALDKAILSGLLTDGPKELVEEVAAGVARLSPRIKNPVFRDEDESRLISIPGLIDASSVRVRKGRFSLATYAPFKLIKFPLAAVIVGPAREQQLNVMAANHLVDQVLDPKNFFWRDHVIASEIPFRE